MNPQRTGGADPVARQALVLTAGWGIHGVLDRFGLRELPSLWARRPADFPPAMQALIDERAESLREPFRGLPPRGVTRPGLFPLWATGVSTAPITEAAAAFVGALSAGQRQRAVFPIEAVRWGCRAGR